MQFDALKVLQAGTMSSSDVHRLLDHLEFLEHEVNKIRTAAVESPQLYKQYAAPGHSANPPSQN